MELVTVYCGSFGLTISSQRRRAREHDYDWRRRDWILRVSLLNNSLQLTPKLTRGYWGLRSRKAGAAGLRLGGATELNVMAPEGKAFAHFE